MTLRVVELFSGIGAQRSALDRAGIPYESVACCEIDHYAYASYCAIHGDTPNLGDITKVEHLPDCDLLTYSFPCQSISLAGKREGFARGSGTRSSLLWEIQRLLTDMKERGKLPETLQMENVAAIANRKNRPEFNRWIDWLSLIGYTSSWKCLNARDFDIPQNRARCYMISRLGGCSFCFPEGKPRTKHLRDVLEDGVPARYYIPRERLAKMIIHRDRNAAAGRGFGFRITSLDGIASCVTAKYREETGTLVSNAEVQGMRIRRLTPRECWRLMDFTDEEYDRAAGVASSTVHAIVYPDGRSRTWTGNSEAQLYKQAGNSICVGVLAAIYAKLYSDERVTYLHSLEAYL